MGEPVASAVSLKSSEAFARLVPIMAPGRLNDLIGGLEQRLAHASTLVAIEEVQSAGLTVELLSAALVVRRDIGRLNDLIHALAIGLTLKSLLEPDEYITVAPSLAAGNDASAQTFDLETDRRAAEFKLSVWTGHDSQRQRGLFSDLVNLAAHAPDGYKAQLFVVGHRPGKWLNGTRSTVARALDAAKRSTHAAVKLQGASADLPIPMFVRTCASRVEIVDLDRHIPNLEAMLAASSTSSG